MINMPQNRNHLRKSIVRIGMPSNCLAWWLFGSIIRVLGIRFTRIMWHESEMADGANRYPHSVNSRLPQSSFSRGILLMIYCCLYIVLISQTAIECVFSVNKRSTSVDKIASCGLVRPSTKGSLLYWEHDSLKYRYKWTINLIKFE